MLFEKQGRHAGQIAGKTPYMQPVHVDGTSTASEALIGCVTPVRIAAAGSNSLSGEIVRARELE